MKDDMGVIDLVTRARNRDKQAWDDLVERYAPLIWSICRRHQLGDADADIVGQNVWLQLVHRLETLHDPAALAGWLATTTRRECVRALRTVQGSHPAGNVPEAETIPDEHAEWRIRNFWPPSVTPRCSRRSATCLSSASS